MQKKFSCNLMLPFMHSDIFLGYVHLQTNFRPYVEMLCTPNDVADAPSKVWKQIFDFVWVFSICILSNAISPIIIKKSSEICFVY